VIGYLRFFFSVCHGKELIFFKDKTCCVCHVSQKLKFSFEMVLEVTRNAFQLLVDFKNCLAEDCRLVIKSNCYSRFIFCYL